MDRAQQFIFAGMHPQFAHLTNEGGAARPLALLQLECNERYQNRRDALDTPMVLSIFAACALAASASMGYKFTRFRIALPALAGIGIAGQTLFSERAFRQWESDAVERFRTSWDGVRELQGTNGRELARPRPFFSMFRDLPAAARVDVLQHLQENQAQYDHDDIYEASSYCSPVLVRSSGHYKSSRWIVALATTAVGYVASVTLMKDFSSVSLLSHAVGAACQMGAILELWSQRVDELRPAVEATIGLLEHYRTLEGDRREELDNRLARIREHPLAPR